MNEKIELLVGIFFLAFFSVGAVALILITQVWFWIAVIAITLINYLV